MTGKENDQYAEQERKKRYINVFSETKMADKTKQEITSEVLPHRWEQQIKIK